jgi:hypothetical protein
MRGFPKHLATPADVELCQKLYPAQTEAYLKMVTEGRFVWEQEKVLDEKDLGKTSETQKVIDTQDEAGKPIKLQLVRKEDPTAHYYRLGLDKAPK